MATSTENQAADNETLMLTLKTSDGEEFSVSERAAVLSLTIKHMLDDDCAKNVIPLANVDSKTLAKIIVYLNKHAADDEEIKEFDDKFVSDEHIDVLFDCVLAANYLNIKGLMDIVMHKIGDIMKNKSHNWVRKAFNVENDFTPEEEEDVIRECQWAFEGVDADDD